MGRWSIGAVAAVLGIACAGHSQELPGQYDTSELACLVSLEGDCCPTEEPRPTCVASFSAAERCASWPAGTELTIFASACQGMTAVRAVLSGDTFSSFYVYDSNGALYAIGDDATTPDIRSGAIACGAGPSGFVVPAACADVWLGAAETQPCSSGTVAPSSVCN